MPARSALPTPRPSRSRPMPSVPARSHTSGAPGHSRRSHASTRATPSPRSCRTRLTLMGQARVLPAEDVAVARGAYLARHEKAGYWVDFEDFAFWRLEVADVYFVGGFAAMDWVTADDYLAARPDPLADAAARS